MTFDNSREIVTARLVLFIATFPFLAFLVLTYIAGIIRFPLLGMSETSWVLILSVIYFILAVYPSLLKYNYVYFSDDGDAIIIRFYSAGFIKGARQAVEIRKKMFAGYKLSRKYGIIPLIVLYEKRREGIAKYPPVSLSALSRKDRSRLFGTLDRYYHKR